MEDKLAQALAYLRERNLYILDPGNRFVYVPPEYTDIRQRFIDEIIDVRLAPLYSRTMDMVA